MQTKHAFLALSLLAASAWAQSPPDAANVDPAPAEPRGEAAIRDKVQPEDQLAPTVSIRQVGNSTVEEYRQSGRLYMVVVHPEHGPDYSFIDTNGDGRLENDPKDGPVTPVFYTLYRFK